MLLQMQHYHADESFTTTKAGKALEEAFKYISVNTAFHTGIIDNYAIQKAFRRRIAK